jgi:hypothetical protein
MGDPVKGLLDINNLKSGGKKMDTTEIYDLSEEQSGKLSEEDQGKLLEAQKELWKTAMKRGWRRHLDTRERRLVKNCRIYAQNDPAGMPGHALALIIAKLADLLDKKDAI